MSRAFGVAVLVLLVVTAAVLLLRSPGAPAPPPGPAPDPPAPGARATGPATAVREEPRVHQVAPAPPALPPTVPAPGPAAAALAEAPAPAGVRSVTGRVVDRATGLPVPGATVRAVQHEGFDERIQRVHADADGSFRLAGLADGMVFLEAAAEGLRSWPPPARVQLAGADRADVLVQVATAPDLTGVVLGPDHRGTAAMLELRAGERVFCCVETGPDGVFRVPDVLGRLGVSAPPGRGHELHVWARSPEHRPGFAAVSFAELTEGRTLEIQLARGFGVTGRVIDPSGAALAGVRLVAWPSNDPWSPPYEATSGAGGAFRFGGLAAGRHRVEPAPQVGALVPIARSVEVAPGPAADVAGVEIVYVSGPPIAGTVVAREDGLPVPERLVTLHHPDWREPRATATDLDGAFRFAAVTDGRYTVAVRGRSFSDPLPPVVLEDVPAGRIDLRAVVDVPPEDGRIVVAARDVLDGAPITGEVVVRLRHAAYGVPTEDDVVITLDGNGEGVIGGRPRAQHRVTLLAPGFAAEEQDVEPAEERLEVLAAFQLRRPVRLRGRVTDAYGRPVEGATVESLRDVDLPGALLPGVGAVSDALGRFELHDVHPEATAVAAWGAGFAPSAVPLAGPAASHPPVTLVLAGGAQVTGTLSLQGGAPAPAIVLALRGALATRYATTAADGAFAFGDVEDGPFELALPQGDVLGTGELVQGQGIEIALEL